MQTVTFSKKQFIARLVHKRIDKTVREEQFIDQNDNVILRLPCYFPRVKRDQFGRYYDDSAKLDILEGNIFEYYACEHH